MLKPDPVAPGADFFLRTKLDDGFHCRDTAFEDFLHGGLADNVLDLSAAEVEVRRQLLSLVCGKNRDLVLPDVLFYICNILYLLFSFQNFTELLEIYLTFCKLVNEILSFSCSFVFFIRFVKD